MSKLRRVTVTAPADVLKAVDALARDLDRSRSWVVARALRDLVSRSAAERPGAVRESTAEPYLRHGAFAEAATSRLERDLALTPEQRVRLAEEVARAAPDGRVRPRFHRVMQFDTFEDYLEWKRFAGIEP